MCGGPCSINDSPFSAPCEELACGRFLRSCSIDDAACRDSGHPCLRYPKHSPTTPTTSSSRHSEFLAVFRPRRRVDRAGFRERGTTSPMFLRKVRYAHFPRGKYSIEASQSDVLRRLEKDSSFPEQHATVHQRPCCATSERGLYRFIFRLSRDDSQRRTRQIEML